MLILLLVITTLMELLAIFFAVKFIKQEIKRLSDNVDACYGSLFGALINIPSWKDMKPRLDGIEAHLKKDEEDVSEVVKKLDALLEKSPSVFSMDLEIQRQFCQMKELLAELKGSAEADEEKHSRDIDEGIVNLLQYQVEKGRSSHDNGSDGF